MLDEQPAKMADVFIADCPCDSGDGPIRGQQEPFGKLNASGKHILVRRDASGGLETTRKVTWAEVDERRQVIERDLRVEVGFDVVTCCADSRFTQSAAVDVRFWQRHAAVGFEEPVRQTVCQCAGMQITDRLPSGARLPKHMGNAQKYRVMAINLRRQLNPTRSGWLGQTMQQCQIRVHAQRLVGRVNLGPQHGIAAHNARRAWRNCELLRVLAARIRGVGMGGKDDLDLIGPRQTNRLIGRQPCISGCEPRPLCRRLAIQRRARCWCAIIHQRVFSRLGAAVVVLVQRHMNSTGRADDAHASMAWIFQIGKRMFVRASSPSHTRKIRPSKHTRGVAYCLHNRVATACWRCSVTALFLTRWGQSHSRPGGRHHARWASGIVGLSWWQWWCGFNRSRLRQVSRGTKWWNVQWTAPPFQQARTVDAHAARHG